jgi:hypothetical protein
MNCYEDIAVKPDVEVSQIVEQLRWKQTGS